MMAVYGEIKNGYLVNVSRTKPDARNTPHEIVELVGFPQGEPDDAFEYDRDNKVGVASTTHRNKKRKAELVAIMERKKGMQDVASELGIDYTTEIAALDSQMAALAAEIS